MVIRSVWAGRKPACVGALRRRSQWQQPAVNDALHDEGAGESLHARKCSELVVVKLLEGGQIRCGDASEVIGLAKQPLRL